MKQKKIIQSVGNFIYQIFDLRCILARCSLTRRNLNKNLKLFHWFRLIAITFGFLLFIFNSFAFAQEQFSGKEEDIPLSSARIFSKVIQKIGLNPNADWFETFGTTNEEEVGKDLYMVVYSKIQDQPRQQANKEVAERYDISEADLVRILYNDYGPLIRRKPQIRQDELQKKINEINATYQTTKDILEMKARLKAKVEISEIFANGDQDDSGFDLINDLNQIENLLFLETNPIDVGHAYKTPAQKAQQVANETVTELTDKLENNSHNQTGNSNNTQNSQINSENSKENSINFDLTTGESFDGSTGNSDGTISIPTVDITDSAASIAADCLPDDNYSDALRQFEQTAKEDERYINLSRKNVAAGNTPEISPESSSSNPGSDPSNTNSKTSGSQEQSKTDSSSTTNTTNPTEDVLPIKPEPKATGSVDPATADVWKQPNDCNDIFCLQVNLIKKPAKSSFSDTDNCITCQVQHINDEMKHVLDHTLTPNKVPGNLLEPAKCKNALAESFSSISMNIYSIGMPVKTPPNDELIESTSVEDDLQRYCEASAFFPFEVCKDTTGKPEDIYVPPPILEEQVAKKVLSELPENGRLQDASTRINEMVNGYIIAQGQALSNLELEHAADVKVRFFQTIQAEMNQMNTYFKNMSHILQSLHEEVDGVAGKQACTDLKNKKECT